MDEVLVFMSVDLDWGYCWAHADVIGYYFVPVVTHEYSYIIRLFVIGHSLFNKNIWLYNI